MSKHTEGPLEYIERDVSDDVRAGYIVKRRPATDACCADPVVARCLEMGGDIAGAEEMRANGLLFTAAPDLLTALKEARAMLETASRYFPKSIRNGDRFSLLNTLANSVEPAIAKAEGRK